MTLFILFVRTGFNWACSFPVSVLKKTFQFSFDCSPCHRKFTKSLLHYRILTSGRRSSRSKFDFRNIFLVGTVVKALLVLFMKINMITYIWRCSYYLEPVSTLHPLCSYVKNLLSFQSPLLFRTHRLLNLNTFSNSRTIVTLRLFRTWD